MPKFSTNSHSFKKAVFIGATLTLISINAQAKSPAKSVVISMNAAYWNFLYGINTPVHPVAINANSFYFYFPDISKGKGQVDYLTQNVSGPIVGTSLSTTITITTTGTPYFEYHTEANNTCVYSAHVRFYIQKEMTNNNYVRWWSNPVSYELKSGSGKMVAPLDPGQWQDTYGHVGNSSSAATAGFKATLASPNQVGMTFGGGCFFGHGVGVKGGTAKFRVDNFKIN